MAPDVWRARDNHESFVLFSDNKGDASWMFDEDDGEWSIENSLSVRIDKKKDAGPKAAIAIHWWCEQSRQITETGVIESLHV